MRARRILVVVAVLATAGCKKESRERRPPPGSAAPLAAVRDASLIDADPLGLLPVIDDIPRISSVDPPSPAASAARKLAADALKLHLAGDLAPAVPLYKQALTEDPGHLMARYNLASAYARLGDRGRALALLKQFKDVACTVCLGRLTRATKDKDWETLWQDPAFRALTAKNVVPVANQEAITLRVAAAFQKADASQLADVLHPRTKIEVSLNEFFCVHDDCGMGDAWDTDHVIGAAALTKWMRGLGRKRHADNAIDICADGCCSLTDRTLQYTTEDVTLALVCFHTDSGGVTFPDRLFFVADPGHDW